VLSTGEPGFEADTGKYKIGNGTAAWASLAYGGAGGLATAADLPSVATGDVAATNVQAAIAELASEKQTSAQVAAAVSAAIVSHNSDVDPHANYTQSSDVWLGSGKRITVSTTAPSTPAVDDIWIVKP
jgi:hypothetical protein